MIFLNLKNRNTNKVPIKHDVFHPISIMPVIVVNNNKMTTGKDKKVFPIKERVKEMLWGQPTWFLFHTLAEKVKEEKFDKIKNDLFSFIKQICNNLPCPDCAQHATKYINGVNFDAILNKEQFKVMLFNFHNEVNIRKNYDTYDYADIVKYKTAITINIVSNFFYHFNKKTYNVKLDISGYQRSNLLKNIRKWMEENYYCFNE